MRSPGPWIGVLWLVPVLPFAQEAGQGMVEVPVVEESTDQEGMLPPEEPYRSRYVHPLSVEEIASALEALAQRHPDRARLASLGASAGGRELTVVVLTDPATGPHDEKPGLFVVGDRGTGRPGNAEAEAALAFARRLAAGADGAPSDLLARATVYVAPLLDPDARATGQAASVGFDQNFPCGWVPEGLRPGAGAIPLARPETLAVARFLSEHENIALVAGRTPEPVRDARPFLTIPTADRRVFAALSDPGPEGFASWTVPSDASGTLFDYAYYAQGSFAIGWPSVSLGSAQGSGGAFEGRVLELVERAAGLAARLPALELVLGEPARLTDELWRLDLRVANTGGLPTESALSRGRRARELTLDVQGARVVATAVRDPAETDYSLVQAAEGGSPALGTDPLDAGSERWIRVILAAESGSRVAVGVQGAWAARAAGILVLP